MNSTETRQPYVENSASKYWKDVMSPAAVLDLGDYRFKWESPWRRNNSKCGDICSWNYKALHQPSLLDIAKCLPPLPIITFKTDFAQAVFKQLDKYYGKPFIAVSAESSYSIPHGKPSKNVVRWYGPTMKTTRENGLVHPNGLGLNLYLQSEHIRKYAASLGQEADIPRLRARFDERRLEGPSTPIALFNCAIHTNPQVRVRAHRHCCSRNLKRMQCDRKKKKIGMTEFYTNLTLNFKYWVAPEGSGVQTHRAWEAIMVGVVPIIIRTPVSQAAYNETDVPVLFVDSYEHLSDSMLESLARTRFSNAALQLYPKKSLFTSYWAKRIFDFRRQWLKKHKYNDACIPIVRCWGVKRKG